MADPSLKQQFSNHTQEVTSICYMSDAVVSASLDGYAMYQPIASKLKSYRLEGHTAGVTQVDANQKFVATSSLDSTVRIWEPHVNGTIQTLKAHQGAARGVQITSDVLLTCGDDKAVKLWSLEGLKFKHSFLGHKNWVRSVRFNPVDQNILSSGSDDKTVRIWDQRTGSQVMAVHDHKGVVSMVDYHQSGVLLASCSSQDNLINVYDVRNTSRLLQQYPDAHGSHSGTLSIRFGGSNGQWMISTGLDNLVKIWDLQEGHVLYTLQGHKGARTTDAVFSDDCQTFATSADDGSVFLWNSGSNLTQSAKPQSKEVLQESREVQVDENGFDEFGFRDESKYQQPSTKSAQKPQKEVPQDDTHKMMQEIVKQLTVLTKAMFAMEERISQIEKRIQK